MAVKSWGFENEEQWIRLEVTWQMSGMSRQRLYVDHHLVAEQQGTFSSAISYVNPEMSATGIQSLVAQFPWKRFGWDRECSVHINSQPIDLSQREVQIDNAAPGASADDEMPQNQWVTLAWAFVLFPFLLVLVLSMVLFSYLALLVRPLLDWIHDRPLKKQLGQRGKLLTEEDLRKKVAEQSGTLLLECSRFGEPARVWWTSEKTDEVSPFPVVIPIKTRKGEETPFTLWCRQRYLDPENGLGFLLNQSRRTVRKQASELVEELANETSGVKVVTMVEDNVARSRKVPVVLEQCHDDGRLSLEKLQELLQDSDPDVLRMAIALLSTLGNDAEPALPKLMRLLTKGPAEIRFETAIAMARLGRNGVDVLLIASEAEDPWVKLEAKAGLEYVNYLENA